MASVTKLLVAAGGKELVEMRKSVSCVLCIGGMHEYVTVTFTRTCGHVKHEYVTVTLTRTCDHDKHEYVTVTLNPTEC